MQTSRKLTQFLFAAMALVVLAASALAQALPPLPSDQRPGSVLVFPYYNSTVNGTVDTRLTITNTALAGPDVAVHLFLISGCSAADMYMCLTPMQQFSIKASEWDPERQGYLVAVAVNSVDGGLLRHNALIGNAFVKDGDYVGNYGAEAFWRYTPGAPLEDSINFDGVEYDAAPSGFLAEIQSPLDATQRIVHASIAGSVNNPTGIGTVGASRVYNQNEILKSFNFGLTSCQPIFQITRDTIRTAPRLDLHIPAGQGGTLYYDVNRGSVGLIMTANRHNQNPVNWSGIRTIHKRAAIADTLTIPVFIPTC